MTWATHRFPIKNTVGLNKKNFQLWMMLSQRTCQKFFLNGNFQEENSCIGSYCARINAWDLIEMFYFNEIVHEITWGLNVMTTTLSFMSILSQTINTEPNKVLKSELLSLLTANETASLLFHFTMNRLHQWQHLYLYIL